MEHGGMSSPEEEFDDEFITIELELTMGIAVLDWRFEEESIRFRVNMKANKKVNGQTGLGPSLMCRTRLRSMCSLDRLRLLPMGVKTWLTRGISRSSEKRGFEDICVFY